MEEVSLLLQCASHIFNLLLLLLEVYVHLLGLGAQPGVLISRDVVLYLQITIHIADFFLLCLPEDGRLVRLGDVRIYPAVVQLASGALDRANWHVPSAAEQDVTRTVVMNDLLVDSIALGGTRTRTRKPSTRRHALVHRLDRDLVECLAIGRLLLSKTVRRGHRSIEKLTIGSLRKATGGMPLTAAH